MGEETKLQKVRSLELVAWVGEDELGSGQVGLKHGLCAAGDDVPFVAIMDHMPKLTKLKPQLEAQARRYGKKIYLVRFLAYQIVDATEAGK